jgi:hypothetical protein
MADASKITASTIFAECLLSMTVPLIAARLKEG